MSFFAPFAFIKTTTTPTPGVFVSISGGQEFTSGSYKIHRITGSTNLTVTQGGDVEILVLAGGAGGGGSTAGGGGAGGLIYSASFAIPTTASLAVTVGSFGAGAPVGSGVAGTNGNNTIIHTLTAYGGGGGGSYDKIAAGSGGSGGGAGSGEGTAGATGSALYPGQGNNGGFGIQGTAYTGGGGGGSSTAGSNADFGNGGAGGSGSLYFFSGSNEVFAGGGGGGGYTGPAGPGGYGGGGAGGTGTNQRGFNADSGSYGCGGGGSSAGGPRGGGDGSSGIVIIKYQYQQYMAYFAKIDDNNTVTQVIVADQEYITSQEGTWLETANDGYRKNYAGVGYTYDKNRDAFIAPKPYNSWTLNEDTCLWEPPVVYPLDNKWYTWDEETTNWKLIN